MNRDHTSLPPNLPVPEDDGAADHLTGMNMPSTSLPATTGGTAELDELAHDRLVAYLYPRTGRPGEPLLKGWDDIPGARGCTPQSCAYRDSLAQFEDLGASVVGISTQSAAEQSEFAAREHIPFPLLSDPDLLLRDHLELPTFEVGRMTLYRRLTLIAEAGRIAKVFYPVFPPDRDAAQALDWLRSGRGHR